MAGQDDRLINEAKLGNKRAFGKLVKKYQHRILFLAYDLVGNYEDAKDIAQETFIRAYQKLSQFQQRAQFSTWLYRITVNLAIDFHRGQKRNRHQSLDELLNKNVSKSHLGITIPTATSLMNNIELKDQIERALDKLSMNQRTATVLKFFHQRSIKEIAEILGCKEGTVRNHLFRAMSILKKTLYELE